MIWIRGVPNPTLEISGSFRTFTKSIEKKQNFFIFIHFSSNIKRIIYNFLDIYQKRYIFFIFKVFRTVFLDSQISKKFQSRFWNSTPYILFKVCFQLVLIYLKNLRFIKRLIWLYQIVTFYKNYDVGINYTSEAKLPVVKKCYYICVELGYYMIYQKWYVCM